MASETNSPFIQDAQLRADIDKSLRHPVMFFFTSGAAWLAVALILGVISSAKTYAPDFFCDCPLFNYGRTFHAHISTLVYGWGAQAAFGAAIWLMARLSRQECRSAGFILAAGHVWNLMVALGTIGILAGKGTGMMWMAFPTAIWPVLLAAYAAIAIWSVIQFRVRRGGHVYVSQWYILAALFWFPWVFLSGNLFINVFTDGHAVMATAINGWFRSALMFLFFAPVAIASAYYLTPKVTGRPVYSYPLAIFGFWALAVIGPWAGMQKVFGAPVSVFLQYAGAGAAILMVIPAIAVAVNILKTVKGKGETVAHSPSLRFTIAGVFGLIVFTATGAILALPSVMKYTQFSIAGYGLDVLGIYGFFSMCMFGAIYFIVPRITNREWISKRLIRQHFWFSLYGVLFIALFCAILGGFQQGFGIEQYNQSWEVAFKRLYPYAVGMTVGWVFLSIASFFFCCHLLLMWLRLGRRSTHPTLLSRHGHDSPHGQDAEVA